VCVECVARLDVEKWLILAAVVLLSAAVPLCSRFTVSLHVVAAALGFPTALCLLRLV